jgi:hypothetical protein
VCPTNIDPAYDRPPESTYICEICGAKGTHIKSLCPQNRDPLSLIMKRKAQGITAPLPQTLSRMGEPWENQPRKHKRNRSTQSTLDSSQSQAKRRIEDIEDITAGISNIDAIDFYDLFPASCNDASRSTKRARDPDSPEFDISTRARKIARVSSTKFKQRVHLEETPSIDDENTEMTDLIFSTLFGQVNQVPDLVPGLRDSHDDQMQGLSGLLDLGFATRSRAVSPEETNAPESLSEFSDDMDIDYPVNQGDRVYSEAVQKLMRRFPQMSEQVNEIKGRKVALQMWERSMPGSATVRNPCLSMQL